MRRRHKDDLRLYVKTRRPDGQRMVLPLRYLTPDERAKFLAKATTHLTPE